jgi:fructokinase
MTKSLEDRPIIFGEVLFDRFPDGTEVLGGAPFNVAWHLQGFGHPPLLLSRVGNDAWGRRVQQAMQAWGLDVAGLQVDTLHPTGLVDIRFEDKHHTFDILANRAYDHIDVELSEQALRNAQGALIYHGTLIIRTQKIRRGLDHLLKSLDIPVFVDVNLRDPWWRAEDLPPLLERARWVKVNDEELIVIAKGVGIGTSSLEATARRFRARYDLDMLVVTLGAQGALAFAASNGSIRVEPEQDVETVDTVGAGDAFSSVVLCGLLEGWPVPVIMRRAQAFASRICAQRGATSEDLRLYQVMRS